MKLYRLSTKSINESKAYIILYKKYYNIIRVSILGY